MNPDIFKAILSALTMLPSIISSVEGTLHSGADKKAKALSITNTGLTVLDQLAPQVREDPKFQDALGKVNDAIVFAANLGTVLSKK